MLIIVLPNYSLDGVWDILISFLVITHRPRRTARDRHTRLVEHANAANQTNIAKNPHALGEV